MIFILFDKQDENKIPLLIILAIIKYYFIRSYRKILYKISLLSGNMYITKLLTCNHLKQV